FWIIVKMIEHIDVITIFVIIEIIPDLAMHLVVGKMVSATRDKGVAAVIVVASLADIQLCVVAGPRYNNVHRKLSFEAFFLKRESECHGSG
ncbi:MAG: hypothetical protein AAB244_04045, partial [Nitrospirota bacterium]